MRLKSFLFFCAALTQVFSAEIEDERTQVSFPKEITVEKGEETFTLKATGVSTRKKFFFNVYSIASYIQEGVELNKESIEETMINADHVKQLTLEWVMNISHHQLKKGLKNNIKKIYSSEQIEKYNDEIKTYNSFFKTEINKGDVQVIRSFPDGTIEVYFNDELIGTINNKGYAEALWSVWFGKRSVVDKERLVSLVQ